MGFRNAQSDRCYLFIQYLLGTFLAAYKDFEDRFALVEKKLPAIEMVRQASMNKLGRFTKQDIREFCPSLSVSAVEGALRKMVEAGEIMREGNGKNAKGCAYALMSENASLWYTLCKFPCIIFVRRCFSDDSRCWFIIILRCFHSAHTICINSCFPHVYHPAIYI